MRVDDAGAQAGRALRDEMEHAAPPPLRTSAPRRSGAFRALAVASVVAVLLTGAVVIVRIVHVPSATRPSKPTGGFSRTSLRAVFGPRADAVDVAGNSSGFVAAVRRRLRVGQVHWAAELWSSSDGLSWSRREGPLRDGVSAAVAATDRGFVAMVGMPRGATRTYISDDGAEWSRGGDLPRGLDPGFLGTDGVVFAVQDPTQNARTPTWLSRDGKRWERRASPYVPLARLGRRAVALTSVSTTDGNHVATTRDLRTWTVVAGSLPPRIGRPLVSDRSSRGLIAVQYEPGRDVAGGRLWTSANARDWSEIASFHRRFPTGNPDHLVQSGRWWVIGGNRGAGQRRRATMWTSSDLQRWSEMPSRLRGPTNGGDSVLMAASRRTVVGVASRPGLLWIWHRPTISPALVRVSGVARSVGGEAPGTASIVHTVTVTTPRGRRVDRVDVGPDGAYALDLPAGRYRLRTECTRDEIVVRSVAVRRDLRCQMK